MTLDTATLRAQWEATREQQGPEAFAMIAHVGDGIALLDALDAMCTERDSWQADVESLHRDLAHSMDRITEEMATVEAERERVRVLREAIAKYRHALGERVAAESYERPILDRQSGPLTDDERKIVFHAAVAHATEYEARDELWAALATAGEEGATT